MGWLSDEPDVDEGFQPKMEQTEVGIVTGAGTADDKGKLPKSIGIKNFTQESSSVSTTDTEQEAALKWFEHEINDNSQKARKAKSPVGDDCDVGVGILTMEPDNCLSVAGGIWWEDDDLRLAHTDGDWGQNRLGDTWYFEEVDYMTRSGRYLRPPHLDQLEASRKDKEAEK